MADHDEMVQMLVARLHEREDTSVDTDQVAQAVTLLRAIANGERSRADATPADVYAVETALSRCLCAMFGVDYLPSPLQMPVAPVEREFVIMVVLVRDWLTGRESSTPAPDDQSDTAILLVQAFPALTPVARRMLGALLDAAAAEPASLRLSWEQLVAQAPDVTEEALQLVQGEQLVRAAPRRQDQYELTAQAWATIDRVQRAQAQDAQAVLAAAREQVRLARHRGSPILADLVELLSFYDDRWSSASTEGYHAAD